MELTAEEREIINLLKTGKRTKFISKNIGWSEATFYRRLKRLCEKFEVLDRFELQAKLYALKL